uniref:Lysosomal protein NCU-G1-B n=1 Tax=Schistocephalus solidus TaxID=70667 RepID=A0A0X3P6I8_SCHSO
MHRSIFLLLVFLTFVWRILGSELYAVKSPGCGESCSPPSRSLVEVVYKNDSSSTHFVLSASDYFKVPSVFVLHSSKNSTYLTFDWKGINKTYPNSIQASGPTTCYGFAFLTLNSTIPIPLSTLSWRLLDFAEVPDSRTGLLKVTFQSEGSRSRQYFKNKGFVSLSFSFSTRNSHASRPPHIFYYEGLSVLVDFTVSRLLDDLSGPSVSLNMAFFAANQSFAEEQNFRTSTVSTINDELTPGVFETNYVYLNEKTSTVQLPNSSQLPPAFVQWHPVFYADPSPELKSSRHVVTSAQTPPTPSALSSVHSSVAYALLGDRLRKGPRPVAWRLQNFTFADSASSTYITWSILLSLGSPHTEVFSAGLWSLMSISCGILVLIFVVASVTTLVRWRIIRRRQNQFTHHRLLDDSDSVLNAEVIVKT